MANDPWIFDQERRCAVVTLRSIVFDGEPTLLAFHDADDHGWPFLDGRAFETSNAALVALEEIVKQDACERRPKSAAPAGLKVWRSGASYTGPNVGPVRELLA